MLDCDDGDDDVDVDDVGDDDDEMFDCLDRSAMTAISLE